MTPDERERRLAKHRARQRATQERAMSALAERDKTLTDAERAEAARLSTSFTHIFKEQQ